MFITNYFKGLIKARAFFLKSRSELVQRGSSRKTCAYSKLTCLAALLILCALSGCSACKAAGDGITTWWEEGMEEAREKARADKEGRPSGIRAY